MPATYSKNSKYGDSSEGNKHKGFASMPKEKIQEIASKGGRSKKGTGSTKREYEEEDDDNMNEEEDDRQTTRRQGSSQSRSKYGSASAGNKHKGFASMPHEKVQEIGHMGGEARAKKHHLGRFSGQDDQEEDDDSRGSQDDEDMNEEEDDRQTTRRQGSSQSRSKYGSSSAGNKHKGFASMPHEKVQEIGHMGGEARAKKYHLGRFSGQDDQGEDDDNRGSQDDEDMNEEEDDRQTTGRKGSSQSRSKYGSSEEGNKHKGFASMPKEKIQEIASKGGRSKKGTGSTKREYEEEDDDNMNEEEDDRQTTRRQGSSQSRSKYGSASEGNKHKGFASMPHEKVQEIGHMGGEARAKKHHLGRFSGQDDQGEDDDNRGSQDDEDMNEEEDDRQTTRRQGSSQSRSKYGSSEEGNKHKGFASMPKEKNREISSMGGRAKKGSVSSY